MTFFRLEDGIGCGAYILLVLIFCEGFLLEYLVGDLTKVLAKLVSYCTVVLSNKVC